MTLLRLSLALLLILATPALAGPPAPGARFDIQLQAPMAFGAPLEAIELDPDEVSAAKVADLNRRGIYTICYVSVGTAEEWRADFDQFPPEVLGREYDDWPGEFFLDARRTDLLLARPKRACDGPGPRAKELSRSYYRPLPASGFRRG
ncbi:MAG: endo alpha-1,4 polygalactosaminidase [Maritimibacter sp.]